MTDELLFSMWNHINVAHFGGILKPPAEIAWLPLSDDTEGIEAFGVYFAKSDAIAIDERFKPDLAKFEGGDQTEAAKVEIAYRLVVHEMIHQAAHRRQLPYPGGHGESFISVATSVALTLGIEPPTETSAGRWPELQPLLAPFGL